MALILNIDTATETATISISEKDRPIVFTTNKNQKDHASFLQPAIKDLLQKADLAINKLNAVAITAGPGSYTGLRVGFATAKGLCYALNIPLIALSTLEVMALSTINEIKDSSALYCPMIDARRMEVFTAVYDNQLKNIINPTSLILNENIFKNLLEINKIFFSGSGILKFKYILQKKNSLFVDSETNVEAMPQLSWKKYREKDFADLFYSSPDYLKELYTLK